MRKILMSAALLASLSMQAQDTYVNHTMVNTTDVIGTARYVGMGGAMGALGADMSTISLNPAGIAMFRRSDISLTAGARWQADNHTGNYSSARGSFDQVGFVTTLHTDGESLKYCNFAFNYQKKADFRHTFIADNFNTGGLSIVDQMLHVADAVGWKCNTSSTSTTWEMPSPLGDALAYAGVIGAKDKDGKKVLDGIKASENELMKHTMGGLHSFDFNFSGNHRDRVYWGATLGVDYLNYEEDVVYSENCSFDKISQGWYDLNAYKRVYGVGVNGKFGMIFRPIEESPLRLAFALETPTFYSLKMNASDDVKWRETGRKGYADTWLDYRLISPWRFRLAAAYTIGAYAAIDVDYEYAMYNRTRVGYDEGGYYDRFSSTISDRDLNAFTRNQMHGVHSLKVGAEFKLAPELALRIGYNVYSNAFKSDAYRQHDTSATAVSCATTTDYVNAGAVNIITLGVGYKFKHAYLDFAYKYRKQGGDSYAFQYEGLQPVDVNLSSHQMFVTLGYKF